MKQKLTLFAILMMALAIPQNVKAYNFSAVAPSGQTLYYTITSNGSSPQVRVTYPGLSSNNWGGFTKPTGSLTIPSTVIYGGTTYSVTLIDNYAFRDCNSLTSVTIGNSVTSIGDYAFQMCNSLSSVTIGNSVTSIGNSAFDGCDSLASVTIPNSVTSIGNYAFSYCYGLASVTIPNSVTSIGNSAFSHCSGLTSVTIGNSVTSIGNSAFSGCSRLSSVIMVTEVRLSQL